jgi:hypothetical protein
MSTIITSTNQDKKIDILHDMFYLDDDLPVSELSKKDQITYHTSMQDQKLSIYKQLLDEIKYRCNCIDDKIKYIKKNYIVICLSDNEQSMNGLYDLIKSISEQLNINLADLTNIQGNLDSFTSNYDIISNMLDETDSQTMMDTISKHGIANNEKIEFNKKVGNAFDRVNASWNNLNKIAQLNGKMRDLIQRIYNYNLSNPGKIIPRNVYSSVQLSNKLIQKVVHKFYKLKGIRRQDKVSNSPNVSIKPLKRFTSSNIYIN